jgi:hypothetical protein
MIEMPCTNDGTPEIGSTGRGRIVSMTCVSGTAQTQLLSPTMIAFLFTAARSPIASFLRSLLQPPKLPYSVLNQQNRCHVATNRAAVAALEQIALMQTRTALQATVRTTSLLTDIDSGFRWKGKDGPNPVGGAG